MKLTGLLLVALAGLGTGTSAWPFKRVPGLHFGVFLFVFMLTGVILIPWTFLLTGISSLGRLLEDIGYRQLLLSNLLSACWGIANILYFVGVIRIGAALTGAVLSAVGMVFGAVIPMLIKGSGLFRESPDLWSGQGAVVVAALCVLTIGIILASKAGFLREKRLKAHGSPGAYPGGFLGGLLLVILAGMLSCGLSLAFVYSQDAIREGVISQGASGLTADFAVWAVGAFGGGAVNIGYALRNIYGNKGIGSFRKVRYEVLFGIIVGVQFISAIILMGKGMVLLGVMGASVGFALQQSFQLIGNQAVGFLGGEWKGVRGRPVYTMVTALLVLLTGIFILAGSNLLF